ncbi:hypothetical protein PBY51_020807 [Eleginops maclovinus]|uniref:G-protein coupled receptors family 1 profile domain-containing protein n=1 Tax=Eleginops maclovinus TaxID=56733 RepID=A0AAN7XSM5_ELEMC|nr:hypothetical protein PBY51_020807 [Eleginops maclovinus]
MSARYLPHSVYFYTVVGSADNLLGLPLNSWALWLIASGKSSLVQSELLTLNLLVMENMCSLWFFVSLLPIFSSVHSLSSMLNFYHAMAVVGRALFQCHVCVDRYLAVLHPTRFIRYKQMKYRGACVAAGWLLVIYCGLSFVFLSETKYVFYIVAFVFLVPILLTELFCSLSIFRVLRKPGPGKKEKGGNRQKKRAVNVICMVQVMLVFNVVPFIVVPFILSFLKVDLTPIAFTLSTVGSSAQAFLFLRRNGKLPCKSKT